ncbi:MAG: bifunctional ornithine acetyltransferase/N-acetylglutamate synthase [Lachnospiraceae bacterium]|nr:bifunctional ornithine acetyltransferase/N-acetylglutamate synthase [Lachnospiraceae bacterium]
MKEDFKFIEGGVTAAAGYTAHGLNCGLNPDKNKNDLALVYSEKQCNAAAVYTTNKVKGAPILVTKRHLDNNGGKARAIIANSKNANTCNANGIEIADGMAKLVADNMNIPEDEVIVASTGVIGEVMSIEPFKNSIKDLVAGLSKDGHLRAENAIMTTDTVPKEIAVEFSLGGKKCVLGGMAKGSGMIHPNMATTLNFLTTDVSISSDMLHSALSEIVTVTYNCLTIDGDTSTNDMVSVMANGMAENAEINDVGEDFDKFKEALYIVMEQLTRMLAKDGEGATKLIEVHVTKAPSKDCAIKVAKSVAGSSLFKCAIFGEDANWGRIACAVGYTDEDFDIMLMDCDLTSDAGVIPVCRNGYGVAFSEEEAAKVLKEDEIIVNICLNQGDYDAKAWGCDLTYDYVKINGDYRS